MSIATRAEPRLRPLTEDVWRAAGDRAVRESPMTVLVNGRYQVRQALARNCLLADDLPLGGTVILRKPGLVARWAVPWWRRRALMFASVRHPNYLNILELVRDGGEEFVVMEQPAGPSLEELMRAGVRFTFDDVVRILPLTALDYTAAFTTCRHGPTAAQVYIELREPGPGLAELATLAVSKWPPFLAKIDLWDLIQPGADCRDRSGLFRRRHLAVAPSVRYTALLTYELLGGRRKPYGGAARGRIRPVRGLNREANALLKRVIRGRGAFASSEEFLWALEKANQSHQVGGANDKTRTMAVSTTPRPTTERRDRATGKSAGLNSKAIAIIAGVIAAAVVVGAVVYEQIGPSHPALPAMPLSGVVTLQTDPPGAQLAADGVTAKPTPSWTGRLKAGSHHLVVTSPGFISKEFDVDVEAGKVKDLGTVVLEPAFGKLLVTADLPDTPYEVIGPHMERLTGSVPATLPQLGPGRYTVHLRPAGWPEYTETVEVVAGRLASVDHTFSGQQNEQAFSLVPFATPKPVQSVSAEADTDNDDEEEPATATKARPHPRPHHKAELSKVEAFRRFEAEWDAKEQAIQWQIAMIDRRMSSASGPHREWLKAQRVYLEKRREYVRDMRRYRRTQLRHRYGAPDSFFDTLRNAFGF